MQRVASPKPESETLAQRKYVRRLELFALTGIKTRTWDDWHQRRVGPRRIKAGKAVVYNLEEVISFLEAQREEKRDR